MDTSLNLPAPAAVANAATPALPRAITTKVQAVEGADKGATLPANKPFVAQIVTARLSGSEFPNNPAEIAPPDRTLRPYDVPMLPYEGDAAANPAKEVEPAPALRSEVAETPSTDS
jgi:hypothetical protein